MDRWTEWDEELGSFLPTRYAKIINPKINYDIHLINYIGILEDKIEELKRIMDNGVNK